jgi:VWFA-related protein
MLGPALPSARVSGQEVKPLVISVPVRVFDGGRFVDDLTIADFELGETGVPQKIEALYLVNKNAVERREGEQEFSPIVARRFTLLFQLFEYHPKLAEAIRYLFNEELRPGDTLEIQTPVRNYILSDQAFASVSKDVLAERMIDIVKTDIGSGSMAYNTIMRDMKKLIRAIGGANTMAGLETDTETEDIGLELLLPRYREILISLDALRRIDGEKIVRFARALKTQPGQKLVFFIYQREFRPEISPLVLNELLSANQDKFSIIGDLQELFLSHQQNFAADIPRMQKAFADSAANFNLLFMNKNPERMARIVMREQSEDIFRVLADIAAATGGIVDTSQNPATAVKHALKTADRYYLLYYFSSKTARDEAFRPLSVRVKGKDYKIVNRQGFFGPDAATTFSNK